MTEIRRDPNSLAPPAAASLPAFILSLVLLGIVVSSMSCGSEDSTFPGNIPFTQTSGTTSTPTSTPAF